MTVKEIQVRYLTHPSFKNICLCIAQKKSTSCKPVIRQYEKQHKNIYCLTHSYFGSKLIMMNKNK